MTTVAPSMTSSPEPPPLESPADWEAFYRDYRKPGYVDGFEITSKLGGGMFGLVFRARKLSIGKDYAIKFLQVDDVEVRRAVLSELEQVKYFAQIDHPNLVSIEDRGEVDGIPYLVMAFAGTETLRDKMTGRPTAELKTRRPCWSAPSCRAARGLAGAARAIAGALRHQAGQRVPQGRCGAAWRLRVCPSWSRTPAAACRWAGARPTTWRPRCCSGAAIARSDVYSMGIMLYELLCGQACRSPATVSGRCCKQARNRGSPNCPRSPDAQWSAPCCSGAWPRTLMRRGSKSMARPARRPSARRQSAWRRHAVETCGRRSGRRMSLPLGPSVRQLVWTASRTASRTASAAPARMNPYEGDQRTLRSKALQACQRRWPARPCAMRAVVAKTGVAQAGAASAWRQVDAARPATTVTRRWRGDASACASRRRTTARRTEAMNVATAIVTPPKDLTPRRRFDAAARRVDRWFSITTVRGRWCSPWPPSAFFWMLMPRSQPIGSRPVSGGVAVVDRGLTDASTGRIGECSARFQVTPHRYRTHRQRRRSRMWARLVDRAVGRRRSAAPNLLEHIGRLRAKAPISSHNERQGWRRPAAVRTQSRPDCDGSDQTPNRATACRPQLRRSAGALDCCAGPGGSRAVRRADGEAGLGNA